MVTFEIYESQEFVRLLELQDSTDLVTKSELLEMVRDRGQPISPRKLTYYMTEGLVPKAVRVGERSGAYPRVVVRMVAWVNEARERGWSIDTIKELMPAWKYLYEAWRTRHLDLRVLQALVARNVKAPEAVHAVPSLLPMTLCAECLRNSTLVLKDGTEMALGDGTPQTVNFIHVDWDPERGEYIDGGFTAIPLPVVRPSNLVQDSATIVMGLSSDQLSADVEVASVTRLHRRHEADGAEPEEGSDTSLSPAADQPTRRGAAGLGT